jgi:terminase, large subunit
MQQQKNEKSKTEWWLAEREAWAPAEDISVSDWAARYRVLPKQSAIPGPWRNSLTPYAAGVMDAFRDPYIEQITIMASVQSTKTESAYNMLGFAICQDPAPALIIMPTAKTLKKVNKRLRSMLLVSPELAAHTTGDPDDLRYEVLQLDRMEIYFGTAGSEADLQFVEARYLLADEIDLYPPGALKMAVDRLTTYWNRKVVVMSRPTTPDGQINREYGRSDRRKYHVPCPACGWHQVLWFKQVKHRGEKLGEWPADLRNPEYIKEQRVARYECEHCQAEIDDRDKPAMLAGGKWVPEGHDFDPATGELAPLPAVSHAGFWWNVLYSPFKNFSEVAAEFFDCRGDREKLRNFTTQWLAEPWKEVINVRPASALLSLRTARPALVVPAGTVALTAGIDTQKAGFWCVIRAWKLEPPESHLVRYGFLESLADLERWLFEDVYTTEDGIALPVWRAGMDTGGGEGEAGEATMTEQVYGWLRARGRGRVFGVKGASRRLAGGKKMQMSIIDRMPSGRALPGGIRLWLLDTDLLKDAIWSRIESGQFFLHAGAGEDYARHLAAEAKERDARGRTAWVVQGARANHLLDCEVYAAAMADPECWGGLLVLPRQPGPGAGDQGAGEGEVNPFTGRGRGEWLR